MFVERQTNGLYRYIYTIQPRARTCTYAVKKKKRENEKDEKRKQNSRRREKTRRRIIHNFLKKNSSLRTLRCIIERVLMKLKLNLIFLWICFHCYIFVNKTCFIHTFFSIFRSFYPISPPVPYIYEVSRMKNPVTLFTLTLFYYLLLIFLSLPRHVTLRMF